MVPPSRASKRALRGSPPCLGRPLDNTDTIDTGGRPHKVLQLHFGAHASARVIGREVGVGRTTVQDYLTRAGAAGLGWPLAPDLTDEALEQLLFPAPSCKAGARRYPEPDWAALVREMKRPGVSLLILWEEYNAVHPKVTVRVRA